MVLLTRGRSQDRFGVGRNSQEITVGSHVIVLNGRHFPAFGAGDEGLVRRVDLEAQNCDVLFEGKLQPVPVALRHLRVASPRDQSVGKRIAANDGDAINPSEHDSKSHMVSGDEHWSALASLVRGPELQSPEPCQYMDSTAGFAAGLAAVSGVAANHSIANGLAGARATQSNFMSSTVVGDDMNYDRKSDFISAAIDNKYNGTPDSLHPEPIGGNSCRDQLQYTSPRNPAVIAAPAIAHVPGGGTFSPIAQHPIPNNAHVATGSVNHCENLSYTTKSDQTHWNGHHVGGHTWGVQLATRSPTIISSTIPSSPVPVDVGWRAARFEALEARLKSVEEEHRAEVMSLRNALEECVHAIGTCAHAIDTMRVDALENCDHAGSQACLARGSHHGLENTNEWESAARALHHAANHGMQALGCTNTNVVNNHTVKRRPSVGLSMAQRGYASNGTVSSIGTPVSVEVVGGVSTAPLAMQNSIENQRRYLVAAPDTQPRMQQVPVMVGGSSSSSRAGTPVGLHPQPPSVPMISGWGSAATPPLPPGSVYQQGPPQQLSPPGNLLGSIPGLPVIHGVPNAFTGSGLPAGEGACW